MSSPPPGISVRAPALEDLEAAFAVVEAKDVDEFGEPNIDRDELLSTWRSPRTDLERDVWLAFAGDRPVGYTHVLLRGAQAEIDDNSGVQPEFRRRGIGSHLLELAEERARESGAGSITGTAAGVNRAGGELFEAQGYRLASGVLRMEIEFEEETPPTEWPDGVSGRPFEEGRDERAVHELIQNAFSELWNHQRVPFERWLESRRSRASSEDPLWLVAVSDDRVIGALLAFDEWILELAVVPEARGRGVALGLLRESFGELGRRGRRRAGLEVEAENPTGAVRLYERAGMRQTRRYDVYEKRLD